MLGIGLVAYIFREMVERRRAALSTQHNNLESTIIAMLGYERDVFPLQRRGFKKKHLINHLTKYKIERPD